MKYYSEAEARELVIKAGHMLLEKKLMPGSARKNLSSLRAGEAMIHLSRKIWSSSGSKTVHTKAASSRAARRGSMRPLTD